MRIAKVIDNQIVELDDVSVLFPNTAFTASGPNDQFLVENSCLRVVDDVTFDNRTQKVEEVAPYILMGVVYTKMAVLLTPEEIATRTAEAWQSVRIARNIKLRETDHVLLPDSRYNETEKATWIVYRDVLRDIPQTQSDPFNIVWPEKPFQ